MFHSIRVFYYQFSFLYFRWHVDCSDREIKLRRNHLQHSCDMPKISLSVACWILTAIVWFLEWIFGVYQFVEWKIEKTWTNLCWWSEENMVYWPIQAFTRVQTEHDSCNRLHIYARWTYYDWSHSTDLHICSKNQLIVISCHYHHERCTERVPLTFRVCVK